MKNPFFSIIIPVYKVEEYIEECVESVLNQSSKNYEIILVDDGSPDKCGIICDEYAKKDKRVKVIHKENGGLSDARNIGLEAATGEYIIFLDSDDFFDDKLFFENIEQIIKQNDCDMLIFGYKELSLNSDKKIIIQPDLDEKKIYSFEYIENHNMYTSSACSKVVKSSIIKNNRLRFRKGVTSEDIEWSALLASYCDKYSVYNSAPYIYRQRLGSITHSTDDKSFNRLVDNVKYLFFIDISKEKETALKSYIAYQYITVLYNLVHIQNYKENRNYQAVKDMKPILKYGNNRKVKLVYYTYKIFGFDLLLKFLKIYLGVNKNG